MLCKKQPGQRGQPAQHDKKFPDKPYRSIHPAAIGKYNVPPWGYLFRLRDRMEIEKVGDRIIERSLIIKKILSDPASTCSGPDSRSERSLQVFCY